MSDITVGEGLAPPETRMMAIGKIVEKQILDLSRRYPSIEIDKHVIMPNHIHLIVSICEDPGGASPSPTLYDVIRVLILFTDKIKECFHE